MNIKNKIISCQQEIIKINKYCQLLLNIMSFALKESVIVESLVTDASKIKDYLDLEREKRQNQLKLLSQVLEFTVTENSTMLEVSKKLQDYTYY